MSFNFGQFRRSQVENYLTAIENYDMTVVKTVSPTSASTIFADKAIQLSSDNPLTSQQSYFIRFKIYKRADGKQIITIKLNNTDKVSNDIQQNIQQIEVPMGSADESAIFEIIISPNNEYDQIQFILNREGIDYTMEGEKLSSPSELDSYYGRVIRIEVDNFSLIHNIIDYLDTSIDSKGELKQIGVQGPVGLLMNINGESIRVGRTGIYEINNGVKITSIGFIIENDTDNFILDYQY